LTWIMMLCFFERRWMPMTKGKRPGTTIAFEAKWRCKGHEKMALLGAEIESGFVSSWTQTIS